MTYDLSWASDAEIDYPVRFSLGLERLTGDVGTGTVGVVTLSGPGQFSVSEDDDLSRQARRERPDNSEGPGWQASRQDLVNETRVQCSAAIATGEHFDRLTRYTAVDVDPIEVVPSAPSGTVEALADGVDLTNQGDRLLPLPFLLRMGGRPPVDELYLSDVGYLNAVTIEQKSSCMLVTSAVSMDLPSGIPGEHSVTVAQRRGCPEESYAEAGSVEERIDDPAWDVRVTGAQQDVAAVLPTLHAVPFAGVKPFDQDDARFDPDAYIDGLVKRSPHAVEVARFDWAGGKVAIVRRGDSELGEAYADPILALPVPFNAGGTGQSCRTHSITIQADESKGFAIIVLQRSNLRVALAGGDPGSAPEPIETVPAAGGRLAALVDLTGRRPMPDIANFVVTEADGTPVGCDQSH